MIERSLLADRMPLQNDVPSSADGLVLGRPISRSIVIPLSQLRPAFHIANWHRIGLNTVRGEVKVRRNYGLAIFDQYTGHMYSEANLPMEGVTDGSVVEFLSSAAESGWELCGCFPSGRKGVVRVIETQGETRKCDDPNEEVAFVFKRV
jgi:hypothetical protein